MTLEERLQQLPKELCFVNEPTDEFINPYLTATQLILTWLRDDLVENEPYASITIRSLEDALDAIPEDMDGVREREEGRREGSEWQT